VRQLPDPVPCALFSVLCALCDVACTGGGGARSLLRRPPQPARRRPTRRTWTSPSLGATPAASPWLPPWGRLALRLHWAAVAAAAAARAGLWAPPGERGRRWEPQLLVQSQQERPHRCLGDAAGPDGAADVSPSGKGSAAGGVGAAGVEELARPRSRGRDSSPAKDKLGLLTGGSPGRRRGRVLWK